MEITRKGKAKEKLTPEMVKIINLHNANEGLSITQLGQLMDPPISKSGMNHRLKKLIEMAEEIENDCNLNKIICFLT